MRRDQIFKICLNHGLTSDIKFLRKDDRSWLWAAKDFSEGEGTTATFVLRFRDVEIAEGFMKAVEKSLVFLSMHHLMKWCLIHFFLIIPFFFSQNLPVHRIKTWKFYF